MITDAQLLFIETIRYYSSHMPEEINVDIIFRKFSALRNNLIEEIKNNCQNHEIDSDSKKYYLFHLKLEIENLSEVFQGLGINKLLLKEKSEISKNNYFIEISRILEMVIKPLLTVIKSSLSIPFHEDESRTLVDKFSSETSTANSTYNGQIFSSKIGFLFFEALLKEFEIEIGKTPLAYLSFIYWNMLRDGYLYNISSKTFIGFLSKEPYCIELDKLKTEDCCTTTNKTRVYSTCKKRFPHP